MIDVPKPALGYGFSNTPGGTKSRRTMMLPELRLLLDACPTDAAPPAYRAAIIDGNALLKTTAESRQTSFEVLVARYALDPSVLVFRALRDLWDAEQVAQPLLALLCALTRDPFLRATAEVILQAPVGGEVSQADFAASIASSFADRFGETTIKVNGRLTAASWHQAGLLSGRDPKVRVEVDPHPAAVAYALLLGHLCGERGDALFETFWVRVLHDRRHRLRDRAEAASRLGWIEYRHAGSVTDVGFRHLLREQRDAAA